MKTVDEVVKGLAPDKLIMTTDFIDFDRACYVSKRDRVDNLLLGSDKIVSLGSNEKASPLYPSLKLYQYSLSSIYTGIDLFNC